MCCSGLSDAVGNDRFFDETYLTALGFPTELQVGEPQVSIDDVTIPEGNNGSENAVFTVSLSFSSLEQVTVQFATAAGTAAAPADFVATSGTLTFAPGLTQQTVTVQVRGERRFESNETFFVNLNSPTNATLSDAQGQGSILNDDPPRGNQ